MAVEAASRIRRRWQSSVTVEAAIESDLAGSSNR